MGLKFLLFFDELLLMGLQLLLIFEERLLMDLTLPLNLAIFLTQLVFEPLNIDRIRRSLRHLLTSQHRSLLLKEIENLLGCFYHKLLLCLQLCDLRLHF